MHPDFCDRNGEMSRIKFVDLCSATARGWVRRSRGIDVQVHTVRTLQQWRVAVAIRIVVGRAGGRQASPSGRLRKLPDGGERYAALAWRRRVSWENTTRRWRARVVVHEENNFSAFPVFSQIIRGTNGRPATFFHRDSGAINPRPEPCRINAIDPRDDIGTLFRKHSTAFLLVKKDDGPFWKSFLSGRCHGSRGVTCTERRCIGSRLDFPVQPPVEQNQKSKAI